MSPTRLDDHPLQVLRAFDALLALDAEAQQARLSELAASDPKLHDELQALLKAESASAGFLAAPLWQPRELGDSLIGPYRLLQRLGSGGMGEVWLAERTDAGPERRVAIKLLMLSSDRLRERFEQERRIVARLQHPHIVQLLDAGLGSKGEPYLVLEWVDGEPITEYLRKRPGQWRECLRLAIEVLDALQYAHAHLVVHRDIKPGNLMVDRGGHAKLLDFGISKLLGSNAPALTRSGLQPMTPDFASPEQVRDRPVGIATDIYSLGVVIFELLTGARPYQLQGLAPSDWERAICDTEPPRPSELARRARLRLPRDLDHIVLKAMAKAPGQRYGSAAAMREDLQRLLDNRPVLARAATLRYRALRFTQRHWLGLVLSTVVLASISGSAVFAWIQAQRSATERDTAQQVVALLSNMLSSADPGILGHAPSARELLDAARGTMGPQLADRPQVAGELHRILAQSYRGLGHLDEALAEAEAAVALIGSDVEAPIARSAVWRTLGQIQADRGDPAQAQRAFAQAQTAIADASGASADLERVQLESGIGALARASNELPAAERAYLRAIALLRALDGTQDAELGQALNNLAVLRGHQGRIDEAVDLQSQSIAALRRAHGNAHPRVARAEFNLANAWEMQGKTADAEVLYRAVLAKQSSMLGAAHPETVATAAALASLLLPERAAEARGLLAPVVRAAAAALPAGDPQLAYAHVTLGEALWRSGQPQLALEPIGIALAARRQQYAEDHPLLLNTRCLLAAVQIANGEGAQARSAFDHSLQQLVDSLGAEHELSRRCARRLTGSDQAD
jgi:eukaryotic-like serine/threonine-protein kinase